MFTLSSLTYTHSQGLAAIFGYGQKIMYPLHEVIKYCVVCLEGTYTLLELIQRRVEDKSKMGRGGHIQNPMLSPRQHTPVQS